MAPDAGGDWSRTHPWRSPGAAPVFDACGVAGGSPRDNSPPGGHPPPQHSWGDRGSALPPLADTAAATWTAGSVVEVSWGIAANHGGGYQYRLCPRDADLTEECFQRTPLRFRGTTQRLRLANGTDLEVPRRTTTTGTQPPQSAWAVNPVPACRGHHNDDRYGCAEPEFEPPAGCDRTCWGDTDNATISGVLPLIIDELEIPGDLAPGDYVLGFRWDCEGTPQIWSSCSDVTIVPPKLKLSLHV